MSMTPLRQASDDVIKAGPSFALLMALAMKKLATPEQSLKLIEDLRKLCFEHRSFEIAFGFSVYLFFDAVYQVEDDLELRTAALEGMKSIEMRIEHEKMNRINRSLRN